MEEVKYAGFWIRVVASIVDQIWIVAVSFVPVVVAVKSGMFDTDSPEYFYFFMFCILIFPAIIVVLLWRRFQSTPGKMMLGLKVVDASNFSQASFGKYSLRYLGYFVSMIPIYIGCFWVGVDKKKRGFHDLIAGTVVIYSKP